MVNAPLQILTTSDWSDAVGAIVSCRCSPGCSLSAASSSRRYVSRRGSDPTNAIDYPDGSMSAVRRRSVRPISSATIASTGGLSGEDAEKVERIVG